MLFRSQLLLVSPVITIVEAKNENIIAGLGQCIAEMVAAQLFNEAENKNDIKKIYGVVTIGTVWKFLKIDGLNAHDYPQLALNVDNSQFFLKSLL